MTYKMIDAYELPETPGHFVLREPKRVGDTINHVSFLIDGDVNPKWVHPSADSEGWIRHDGSPKPGWLEGFHYEVRYRFTGPICSGAKYDPDDNPRWDHNDAGGDIVRFKPVPDPHKIASAVHPNDAGVSWHVLRIKELERDIRQIERRLEGEIQTHERFVAKSQERVRSDARTIQDLKGRLNVAERALRNAKTVVEGAL